MIIMRTIKDSPFDVLVGDMNEQMFCMAEPPYDKSIQQLQSFLEGLIADEKIEMREGMYLLKR